MNDMTIEWRPVVGFPSYVVSNTGLVKRIASTPKRRMGCVLKPWRGNHQYDTVGLSEGGQLFRRLVHRLVCEAFHGPAPSADSQVAHNDGTRRNNHAENLRWASRSENMADCLAHGTRAMGTKHGRTMSPERTPRGERHGHAKLREQDVLDIRRLGRTVSGADLARRYGTSPAAICNIRSGKTWRHI